MVPSLFSTFFRSATKPGSLDTRLPPSLATEDGSDARPSLTRDERKESPSTARRYPNTGPGTKNLFCDGCRLITSPVLMNMFLTRGQIPDDLSEWRAQPLTSLPKFKAENEVEGDRIESSHGEWHHAEVYVTIGYDEEKDRIQVVAVFEYVPKGHCDRYPKSFYIVKDDINPNGTQGNIKSALRSAYYEVMPDFHGSEPWLADKCGVIAEWIKREHNKMNGIVEPEADATDGDSTEGKTGWLEYFQEGLV